MKLKIAFTLIAMLMQAFGANYVRIATCTECENGIAFYDVCGNEFGEYSDVTPGETCILFMNDNGTEDIYDDIIEYSFIIEE